MRCFLVELPITPDSLALGGAFSTHFQSKTAIQIYTIFSEKYQPPPCAKLLVGSIAFPLVVFHLLKL
jgi:hypothetical protein